MTLVYCGSLVSVHSNKPSSPSRVVASCSTSPPALFFVQVRAGTVLRTLLPTHSECLCTNKSDHVALDGSTWKLSRRCASGIRSSGRSRAFPSRPVVLVRASTTRSSVRSLCLRTVCLRRPMRHVNQYSQAASEGSAILLNFAAFFWSGCARVRLWAQSWILSSVCRTPLPPPNVRPRKIIPGPTDIQANSVRSKRTLS